MRRQVLPTALKDRRSKRTAVTSRGGLRAPARAPSPALGEDPGPPLWALVSPSESAPDLSPRSHRGRLRSPPTDIPLHQGGAHLEICIFTEFSPGDTNLGQRVKSGGYPETTELVPDRGSAVARLGLRTGATLPPSGTALGRPLNLPGPRCPHLESRDGSILLGVC